MSESDMYARLALADETAGLRAWSWTMANQRPAAKSLFRSFVVEGLDLAALRDDSADVCTATLGRILALEGVGDYAPELGELRPLDGAAVVRVDAYTLVAELAGALNREAGECRHRAATLRRDLSLAQTALLDMVEGQDPICFLAHRPWCAYLDAADTSLSAMVILPRQRKLKLLLATWPAPPA